MVNKDFPRNGGELPIPPDVQPRVDELVEQARIEGKEAGKAEAKAELTAEVVEQVRAEVKQEALAAVLAAEAEEREARAQAAREALESEVARNVTKQLYDEGRRAQWQCVDRYQKPVIFDYGEFFDPKNALAAAIAETTATNVRDQRRAVRVTELMLRGR